ncbi:hypothetical protein [Bdellovibrio sp. KM01]|uniref:hypothetical protein n=1 Tax=Bdellovibrio sp. KM01 TaxID=2748865 RepID=UPI0015E9AF9E|nr:hypothetical protein [Bdellovibrio sp. KM01]QLY24752.1 hypothetical protein HW988_15070 [Bdellovibrio sp. KM01]
MKKQTVLVVIGGALIVAGAAYASEAARVKPLGGPIDTFTFADGAVVQSAFISSANSGSMNVVQIKNSNGQTCYAVTGSSGQYAAISCLPQ